MSAQGPPPGPPPASPPGSRPGPPPGRRPGGLLLATLATVAEGVALLAFGAWLAVETRVATAADERMAAGSAVYFLVVGLLVLLVSWALWRRRSWALGAALFVQLVAIPVAWTMAQGGLLVGAVPLAVVALGAAGALVQPATRSALGRE